MTNVVLNRIDRSLAAFGEAIATTSVKVVFASKQTCQRAVDVVLSELHDDTITGALVVVQRHTLPKVAFIGGSATQRALNILTREGFKFTQSAVESVSEGYVSPSTPRVETMTFDDAIRLKVGQLVMFGTTLHTVASVRTARRTQLTYKGTPGDTDPSYTGPQRELKYRTVAVTLRNDFGQKLKPISFSETVGESVNEMAATYVPITREEFEAWLTEVWGAGNWNIRSGSVGVYRLKLGPKVSLEVSSSIGRADTNMGVGEAAIHVAMVGRVTGRVLNKKATGKSRVNRTKGWKGNLLAALKALEAAYKASPAFYEAISDPESYKDEMLGRIAAVPGSDSSDFWASLRDAVASGRVLSDKQTAIVMRETPAYKHTPRSAPTPTAPQIRQAARLQARDYQRDTGGGRWSDFR